MHPIDGHSAGISSTLLLPDSSYSVMYIYMTLAYPIYISYSKTCAGPAVEVDMMLRLLQLEIKALNSSAEFELACPSKS